MGSGCRTFASLAIHITVWGNLIDCVGCLWPEESLRETVTKEAQLMEDKDRLVDALTKLTERNEQVLEQQRQMMGIDEQDQKLQSDIIAALEKQNGLLRQRVEEQEDEISELEKRMSDMRTELPQESKSVQ